MPYSLPSAWDTKSNEVQYWAKRKLWALLSSRKCPKFPLMVYRALHALISNWLWSQSATVTKIAITEFHCFTALSALIRSSLFQLFLVVKSNGILLPLISCLIISYHPLPDISILHFFSGSFPLGNKYARLFTYT